MHRTTIMRLLDACLACCSLLILATGKTEKNSAKQDEEVVVHLVRVDHESKNYSTSYYSSSQQQSVPHHPEDRRSYLLVTEDLRTLLRLELQRETEFVVPDLLRHTLEDMPSSNTTHDATLRINTVRDTQCFYTGAVPEDSQSHVSVSLCRGMFGYIRTRQADYTIQPIRKEDTSARDDSEPHILTLVGSGMGRHDNTSQSQGTEYCGFVDQNEHDHQTNRQERRRKLSRRSVSMDRYVEVMVVADSRMARYHGDNLDIYILTLMSTVALIYKDPSIGNSIHVAVTKIMKMSEAADSEVISPSASKTLRNFCKWQQQYKHYDHDGYGHFDTAILLTREDLCRLPKTCDTLGLAQSGMVCDRYSSCAIVEDNGLSAAFTIAHELGHVLSIPHDDDHKCMKYHSEGQRLHVMARMLDYNSHPWSWSACSRHYITTFLDSGYGECLLNRPTRNRLNEEGSNSVKPPGEVYDMDLQCQLVFGKGSRICPYMPVCKRLWCTMNDVSQGGCRTQHMPWADGTSCGRNKWCQHGECVRASPIRPEPVDGEWGPWQTYSTCSRSCGGGVKKSVRECDSPRPENGGRYCVGRRVRFRSCNTEECPASAVDFRDEQCSAFNGKTLNFQGLPVNVKWTPQYTGIISSDRCKLYCRVVGTGSYYLLKEKVIDGTPCGPDSFDVCVNGVCMSAGCDHKLESELELDVCGVCGGNNSTCKEVDGHFNKVDYGYNHVVMIPPSASNIDIRQYGYHGSNEDDNYLALKGRDNEYLLNGNFTVSMFRKTLSYGGVVLEYSGSAASVERINATKPLKKELYVQVLTVGSMYPPNITFRYTVSLTEELLYQWELESDWSPCNKVCQGERFRKPRCVRKEDRIMVSDGNCRQADRPMELAQVCNLHCQLRWHTTRTSECSNHCGRGTRQRVVKCVQEINELDIQVLHDQFCDHLGTKPADTEECSGPCRVAHWKYGEWSKCSKSCGNGDQTRSATCVDDSGATKPDSECESGELMLRRLCNDIECPQWDTGEWTPCSTSCGIGERQRGIWCRSENMMVAPSFCNSDSVPQDKETCHGPPCITWDHGNWGPCSVTCGPGGLSRRVVRCRSLDGALMDSEQCRAEDRPPDSRECEGSSLCPAPTNATTSGTTPALLPLVPLPEPVQQDTHTPKTTSNSGSHDASSTAPSASGIWRTGMWSECSTTCGDGTRNRVVSCQSLQQDGSVLPENVCDPDARPVAMEVCRLKPCGTWRIGEWSQCPVTCGQSVSTRYVACMHLDDQLDEAKDCDQETRPVSEKLCNMVACGLPPAPLPAPPVITHNNVEGVFYWRTGPWGECSRTCGGGEQRRQVVCYDELGQTSNQCEPKLHPPETSPCNTHGCPEWSAGEWGKCNKSCGGGYQLRPVHCVAPSGDETVPDYQCNIFQRPQVVQKCNTQECGSAPVPVFRWYLGPWSSCSAKCGRGTEQREVLCINEKEEAVLSSKCDGHPPENARECERPDCPRWTMTSWSHCSAQCGNGTQVRRAECRRDGNAVDNSQCKGPKPSVQTRSCYLKKCPFYWRKRKWSKCSASCGRGTMHREVYCADSKGSMAPNKWCNPASKPKTFRKCRQLSCPFLWKTGEWSTCSRTCNNGVQSRKVTCHQVNTYGWVDPSPAQQPTIPGTGWCNNAERPPRERVCNHGSCNSGNTWNAGPWLPCSVACGTGRQRRRVRCYDPQGKRLPPRHCNASLRPRRRRKCHMRPCAPISCLDIKQRSSISSDGEYDIFMRGHTVKIYCAMMNSSSPKEYITLPSGDSDNYSEIFSKRLTRANTCPYGGARPETCDCYEDSRAGAGLTTFSRIAINISTLQVAAQDFNFAQTHHGRPVPYGESGDCYSTVYCPQGRFSISLLGTGFLVSPHTQWVTKGIRPTKKIQTLEGGKVIQGKCGGYCGWCSPDPSLGLLLDVAPP